jgi:hypothetical protein
VTLFVYYLSICWHIFFLALVYIQGDVASWWGSIRDNCSCLRSSASILPVTAAAAEVEASNNNASDVATSPQRSLRLVKPRPAPAADTAPSKDKDKDKDQDKEKDGGESKYQTVVEMTNVARPRPVSVPAPASPPNRHHTLNSRGAPASTLPAAQSFAAGGASTDVTPLTDPKLAHVRSHSGRSEDAGTARAASPPAPAVQRVMSGVASQSGNSNLAKPEQPTAAFTTATTFVSPKHLTTAASSAKAAVPQHHEPRPRRNRGLGRKYVFGSTLFVVLIFIGITFTMFFSLVRICFECYRLFVFFCRFRSVSFIMCVVVF